eukprot:764027-Hanusia_phi.AAC.2
MLEASINLQQTDEALLDSKDKLTKAAQSLKKSSSALGSKQLCGPTVSEITSAFKLICSNPQNVVSADIVISAIKNNRDMCSLLKVYKSEDKANAINRFNELLSERKNHGMDQDEIDFQCFLTAEVHWLLNNMPVSLHGKSINTPKEKLDQLHGSLKMKFDKQQEERQRLQWELESLDLKSVGQNLQKLLADTDEFEASKANALMLERRRLEQEHIDILSSKIREIELSIQDTKSKMKHELSRNKILRQTGARRKTENNQFLNALAFSDPVRSRYPTLRVAAESASPMTAAASVVGTASAGQAYGVK